MQGFIPRRNVLLFYASGAGRIRKRVGARKSAPVFDLTVKSIATRVERLKLIKLIFTIFVRAIPSKTPPS
jgi:hypothetical protein